MIQDTDGPCEGSPNLVAISSSKSSIVDTLSWGPVISETRGRPATLTSIVAIVE